VTIGLFCTVMEIWRLKSWTDARTDGCSGDFILYIGQTIINALNESVVNSVCV